MGDRRPLLRCWWSVCVVALSALGPARAETSFFTAATEEDWTTLLEVQKRVPGYAGLVLTPTEADANAVTPLLVFPNLVDRAAAVIGEMFKLKSLPSALPARYSARTLVGAARRIAAQAPSVQPQVDVGLNRVVVTAPPPNLDRLAREWGVSRALLVTQEERPQFGERLVVVGRIREGEPLESRLRVQVSNPLDRPAAFLYGCGGALPLRVLNLQGQPLPEETPESKFVCTAEERQTVLQPGETREFPTFPLRLNAPRPGDYLLQTGQGEVLPLLVWPR